MHDPPFVLEELAEILGNVSTDIFHHEIHLIEKQKQVASIPFSLFEHPPPEISMATTSPALGLMKHTNALVQFI